MRSVGLHPAILTRTKMQYWKIRWETIYLRLRLRVLVEAFDISLKEEILLIIEKPKAKMGKTKECRGCKTIKSISEFWVRSDNKKPRNTCKSCQKNQSVINKKNK